MMPVDPERQRTPRSFFRSTPRNGLAGTIVFPAFLTALFFCAQASAQSSAADYAQDIKPLLTQHCVRCHGPEKHESDFRIDTLELNFANVTVATHWTEMMDRINTGEMPPKAEPRPPADQMARVAEWIAAQLTEAEAARQAATGEKVSFRKLTREEYRNTIRDLLGVTYDATDPTGLPEDPDWQGFERIGTVLSLSATHVEKYLAAAETVLSEALALGPEPKSEIIRWTAAKLRVRGDVSEELKAKGILDKVRADIVPNNGALDAHDLKINTTGQYIIRVKLSGLGAPGGRAARLRLYATDISRTLLEQDVDAPEDDPVTLEVRTPPAAGHASDPHRQCRSRTKPRRTSFASDVAPSPSSASRPASPGRSSSPTTTSSRSGRPCCWIGSSSKARCRSRGRRLPTSGCFSPARVRPRIWPTHGRFCPASPPRLIVGRCGPTRSIAW